MPTPFVQSAVVKLPENIRKFFQAQGAVGGKKRARSLTPEARIESARKAARARWAAKRAAEQSSSKKSFKKSNRGA